MRALGFTIELGVLMCFCMSEGFGALQGSGGVPFNLGETRQAKTPTRNNSGPLISQEYPHARGRDMSIEMWMTRLRTFFGNLLCK